MSEQPEVRVERGPVTQNEAFAIGMAKLLEREGKTIAAAELRRQHEEITELRHGAGVAHQTIAGLVAQRDALLAALELALSSHGVMLASDPPQEAWKVYGVEAKARAAIKMVEEGE